MKKIILILGLITNNMMGYSQHTIPQSLIYSDSIFYFNALNNNIVKIYSNRIKKRTYININEKITDSLNIYLNSMDENISSCDTMCEDIIYKGVDSKGINIYKLSLISGKLDTILREISHEKDYYVTIGNQLIGSINQFDTIYGCYIISYDVLTRQRKILYKIDEDEYSIWGIDISASNMLLVCLGNDQEDKILYYVFDFENNIAIKKDYSVYVNQYEIYDDFSFSHDDISAKYMIYGKFWLDTIFNIVQPTLKRSSVIQDFRGFKLKTTDSYYYLTSEIDEPLRKNGSDDVWLACRFTLPFDMCLYKIYNNQILTGEEISKFDEWELHKLKNMIFAKHGYKFKSHYLQAFYNLFAFYKGRLTDVSHLLTPEDKKNLELIQK
jgi:hypothetical protein